MEQDRFLARLILEPERDGAEPRSIVVTSTDALCEALKAELGGMSTTGGG